jgi:uncharacterized protein (DUF2249 family)
MVRRWTDGTRHALRSRKAAEDLNMPYDAHEPIIDVRMIAPRDRHPLIFRTFDRLLPGGTLQLVNDHDPAPLRHHFQAEYGNRFTWEYLEAGPEVWRVRIARPERESCCGGCGG